MRAGGEGGGVFGVDKVGKPRQKGERGGNSETLGSHWDGGERAWSNFQLSGFGGGMGWSRGIKEFVQCGYVDSLGTKENRCAC